MKITMFGTGYVGLVTGACLAEMGNDVLCVDIDAARIEALLRGEMPIHEDKLDELVQRNVEAGRLGFTTSARAGVDHGEILFIAVGTPSNDEGAADLRFVLEVARTIGQHMTREKVVVNKSTVPVGTGDQVEQVIQDQLDARGETLAFSVVSNPEFLKEGAAINDFMKPDRIIIGSTSERGAELLEALYQPFNRNHDKILHMDVRSAELSKYAANVMLAAKISLMNEFSNLAERLDADIESVRQAIGADPRIGYHFIYPGAGYGGSCFPKDVRALAHLADSSGYAANIIPAIEQTNQQQKHLLFQKIQNHFGSVEGKTFALWGLSFKPNTDDMREAPSQTLVAALSQAGARIQAYDPVAGAEARRLFGTHAGVSICESKEQALNGADALVVITEWNEFRSPDLAVLKAKLRFPLIFDGRNLYDPRQLSAAGLEYKCIGRGKTTASPRAQPLAGGSHVKKGWIGKASLR